MIGINQLNVLLADPVEASRNFIAEAQKSHADKLADQRARREAEKKKYEWIDEYDSVRRHVGYHAAQAWLAARAATLAAAAVAPVIRYVPPSEKIEGFFKAVESSNNFTDSMTADAFKNHFELLDYELNESGFLKRKQIEIATSDFIDSVHSEYPSLELDKVAEKLRNCRSAGNHGIRFGTDWARRETMWDSKCNISKSCPHESRAEAMRLYEKYSPHCMKFLKSNRKNRIHFAVLTEKNAQVGELRNMKNEMFKKIAELCRLADYLRESHKKGSRRRRRGDETKAEYEHRINVERSIRAIRGVLAIQEDPLSASRDWNVHLNVLFLTSGQFDYSAIQEYWGASVSFGKKTLTAETFSKAFKELSKYCVAAINEKSHDESHKKAPGMLEWSAEEFVEWWIANKGFRRTRAYGILYGVEAAEEEDDQEHDESEFIKLGRVAYHAGEGRYVIGAEGTGDIVFLIQGDKSGFQNRKDLFIAAVSADKLIFEAKKSASAPASARRGVNNSETKGGN